VHKNSKNAHKDAKKKFKTLNLAYTMLPEQGKICAKNMSLLPVLGSQGIVVKCTAAIFFHMVD